jgi:hypothetical protein
MQSPSRKEIMDGGPLTYEHWFPYINLIFAVGHLERPWRWSSDCGPSRPKMMFLSRDLQYDYIAARRFPESETEYRRSLALEGNPIGPAEVAFARMLAGKDSDPEALGDLHRQLLQSYEKVYNLPSSAISATCCATATPCSPSCAGPPSILSTPVAACPLPAAGSTGRCAGRRRPGRGGAAQSSWKAVRASGTAGWLHGLFPLWIAPYSRLRSHPEFQKLLVEMGVVDYWRQTGKWGDGCKPVGADDFECQ